MTPALQVLEEAPWSPAPPPTPSNEPVEGWAKIPHGLWMREATSVAVDSEDRVYVFNRGKMPVLVFDPGGNLVDRWGNGSPYSGTEEFIDPYGNTMQRWSGAFCMGAHAITVDPDDNLWLTDDTGNLMRKTARGGETLMTIGTGELAPRQSGEMFNRPTSVTVDRESGDLFISDGYGNSRVYKFDAVGNYLLSWGEPGTRPGQFSLPHNVATCGPGRVIVCDRENYRVQVFTTNGEWVNGWHVHKAVAAFDGRDEDTNGLYRPSRGRRPFSAASRTSGYKIGTYTREGELIQKIGAPLPGEALDQFNWLHSAAVDSEGSIYAAEVSFIEVGRTLSPQRELVSLRKWARVRG